MFRALTLHSQDARPPWRGYWGESAPFRLFVPHVRTFAHMGVPLGEGSVDWGGQSISLEKTMINFSGRCGRCVLPVGRHGRAKHRGRAHRVGHRAADSVGGKACLLAVRLGEDYDAIPAKADR